MKNVVLIVIDALTTRVVEPALRAGRLPNLQALADAGLFHPECVAVFPSITPAATSALITGCYPKEHGISGAYWYIPHERTVIYFGYDIWAVIAEGLGEFVGDFLVRLNRDHLRAETIYQRLERNGLSTASLNYLIFHGNVPHEINGQLFLDLLPDTPAPETMEGAAITYFGDFIRTPLPATGEELDASNGPLNRFGFADETSADLLIDLTRKGHLPPFTVAYFPENDARSHEVGPEEALDQLAYVDRRLGEWFEASGGLERLLDDVCVVVTGDHSQSNVVADEGEAGVRLDEILAEFNVAEAGTPMQRSDEMVICPNLCSAQIYFHSPDSQRIEPVVECLLADGRIDQAIWNAGLIDANERGYRIRTRDRGDLRFWPGDDGPHTAADRYGCTWSWEGDLRTVDGDVSGGRITFGDYPNAFERIHGILELPTSGHLWLTSYPGFEFCLEHTTVHVNGGSHGALHRKDSISPLFVAGAPGTLELPEQMRSVDVMPLCLSVLGVEPPRPVGASHVTRRSGL